MKKVVLLLIVMMSMGMSANAQKFDARRLTLSGGIGLQFGNYTLVNINPQLGYSFNRYFNAGAGVTYTHYRRKYDGDRMKETKSYGGLNLYAKFYPLPFIVLMAQPEFNRMWRKYENYQTGLENKTDKVVGTFLVGAGVRLGPMQLLLQYDVAQNNDSPYGNRVFYSVGYTFSF